VSEPKSQLPKWFWYTALAVWAAATFYYYPQAARDMYDASNPYAQDPGAIAIAVVAAFRAAPFSLVACGVIYFLAFDQTGRKVGNAVGSLLGATFGFAIIAAIGLGVLSAIFGPGSCSSDPGFDREYRAP